ncbi:5-hydroxytryptamine receptor 6 [Gadus macrocephalus]|uniref:5-hydroxytryptamine receptor 6 n=1 Tax=Gadus macrocephalus TaxID=80720 RepID=UPI0028CBB308|nr:5-hydroxytryptamine receptor 6 [Gadus macrocephalus]
MVTAPPNEQLPNRPASVRPFDATPRCVTRQSSRRHAGELRAPSERQSGSVSPRPRAGRAGSDTGQQHGATERAARVRAPRRLGAKEEEEEEEEDNPLWSATPPNPPAHALTLSPFDRRGNRLSSSFRLGSDGPPRPGMDPGGPSESQNASFPPSVAGGVAAGAGGGGGAWGVTGSGPWLLAFMLGAIILVTTCGNVLLIALVLAHRALRCTSNCFLVSLFLSDLMVALVVMPPAMLNVLCGGWVLWPAFCPVWLCFDVMCCSASILNLCVISLDRYLLIISPLRYKQRMTPPHALLLVAAAWGLAALASFLPIEMRWHSLGHGGGGVGGGGHHLPTHGVLGGGEGGNASLSSYGSPAPYPPPYFQPAGGPGAPAFQCRLQVTLPFALVASVLTFFLPSGAICFTYCRILLAARRQARRVAALSHPPLPHQYLGAPSRPPSPGPAAGALRGPPQEGDDYSHQEPTASCSAPLSVNSERRQAHRQGRRALKASLTLGVLLGLFFGAWLPFFITNMAEVSGGSGGQGAGIGRTGTIIVIDILIDVINRQGGSLTRGSLGWSPTVETVAVSVGT